MQPAQTESHGRGRLFYGWWIVVAAALMGTYSGGTYIYGITVFVNPIIREFGWSYLIVAGAVSVTGSILGLFSPLVGGLVDRFGSKRLIIICGAFSGAGFVILGFTNSLPVFFTAFGFMSVGSMGTGSIVLQAVIANWFRRRVGLAMGATSAGVGMGGLLLPVISWLVLQYEWRTASIVLGIGTIVILTALAQVMRQRPEDHGYLPDGERLSADFRASQLALGTRPPPAPEVKVRRALKTSTFWFISLAISIYFMGLNAIILHIVPYLESVGMPAGSAALVATFLPIFSITGRLGYGWLGDRIPRKYVLAITLGSQALGLAMFLLAPATWALALFTVAYGPGFGGSIATGPAMVRDYFGRTSFGTIQGWLFATTSLGGMAGPVLAGWMFDSQQSYALAWAVFAAATAAVIVPVVLIRRVAAPRGDGRTSEARPATY